MYKNPLVTSDDGEYDVYLESLCNLDTKWVETGGEKTKKRMGLCSESKIMSNKPKHLTEQGKMNSLSHQLDHITASGQRHS
ncbi:hypothetical protein RYX36_034676 [Vicia faba]